MNLPRPEPEKDSQGLIIMTERYCSKLCEYNGYYSPPHLNDNLHLHHKGFRRIENLDRFINVKVLYLENNCISKIENLSCMKNLSCLYLQNNFISKIENLDHNLELCNLNLSFNRISKVENLSHLLKIEYLYLERNELKSPNDIKDVPPNVNLLDIQSNQIDMESPDEMLTVLSSIEKLRVLYFKNNPGCRKISNYRKTLIHHIENLTYLDDRPVKEEDHLGVKAYFIGGLDEERKVRDEYRRKNDRVSLVREQEKEMMKVNFEERRAKALESLRVEYEKRKNELEEKKRKLMEEREVANVDKALFSMELSAVDYQIKENEKFKVEEEKDVIATISKRERVADQYAAFEFEPWMEPICETHVVENLFDFNRALKLIQLDLKVRNVKNWELFNFLDLRTKWTEIEIKKFRKDKPDEYIFPTKLVEEDKNQLEKNSIQIKEETIDDEVF